jgi:hypothetical protein
MSPECHHGCDDYTHHTNGKKKRLKAHWLIERKEKKRKEKKTYLVKLFSQRPNKQDQKTTYPDKLVGPKAPR